MFVFNFSSLSKDSESEINLTEFINNNKYSIKEFYLDSIDSSSIKFNKFFEQKFVLNRNIDLWLMSSFLESSAIKNDNFDNHLKVVSVFYIVYKLKLENILIKNVPLENKQYFDLFKNDNINISYLKSKRKISYKDILPHTIQAFIWIILHFFRNINMKSISQKFYEVSFFGSFSHIKQGESFYSNIWGELPYEINKLGLNLNFFHNFLRTKNFNSLSSAINFTKRTQKSNLHYFTNSFFSIKILKKIILHYIGIVSSTFFLRLKFIKHLDAKNDFLFHLKFFDFQSSVKGRDLIENIYWCVLFDEIFSIIPTQNFGIFIQENQGWEIALTYNWKLHGHGALISYQHATIPFWDLRYKFIYGKTNCKSSKCPDFFAVNSNSYLTQFLKYQYPSVKIKLVESTRFTISNKLIKKTNKKILAVGGSNNNENKLMLDCITQLTEIQYTIHYKAHPTNLKIIHDQRLELVSESISNIIHNYSYLIVASSSGASVDGYINNKNVFIYCPDNVINLNPIEDVDGIYTFSNYNQLLYLLKTKKRSKKITLFEIDKTFGKWKKLIKQL